jgi:transposase
MRKIKECFRLKFTCGLSHEQIARALGLSKGVVTKYLQRAARAGLDGETAATLAEPELAARLQPVRTPPTGQRVPPDLPLIHRELRRKGVTLQLLWEEYVAAHPGAVLYRYTQFCHLYREYAGRLKRSMRQTHRAGEKLFIDYAGPTVPLIDPATGEIRPAHIFVAVLGASNYTFACATPRETQADWLGSLVKALAWFGGVPEMIVPDNPRALIARPDRYEPELGRMALDFAQHYGTVVLPARPGRPKDKAKAEQGVLLVERWVLARLRHHRFFSLGELNQALAGLLVELNQRPFKKLPGCRQSWFESLDRPALRPLPALPYEIAGFKRARVNIDYHIEIDGHYYSVPHRLVRQEVEARITSTTVNPAARPAHRQPSPLRSARLPYHPRRAHAQGPPGPSGLDAGPPGELGATDRPEYPGARGTPTDPQTASRNGLSGLSGVDGAGPQVRRGPSGSGLYPGRGRECPHLSLGAVHSQNRPGSPALGHRPDPNRLDLPGP